MASKSETQPAKTSVMNLRIQPSARDLIDRAAQAAGKNRTDFVIEAARREAEAVLLDRRLFSLSGEAFKAFTAALDKPPAKNPQLKRLLGTTAPWER
ncbi:type II toxin-antitoxin system TacA family antitoxin [Planctomicrobium piriforme]|uniref:Uncharacterized conserved protein, DUF1778 family n=1 Tax=Planctomicrobium piriforme TaxID=1576369 RepID=A0A1I3BGE2_9PLAN|nr:DUF1778 domain-containing protein [Planctomicrobium piriforme]SFH61343.1 Uncharacterized conserved protein, DUF1778 family [Planctomicrobium piriforme]